MSFEAGVGAVPSHKKCLKKTKQMQWLKKKKKQKPQEPKTSGDLTLYSKFTFKGIIMYFAYIPFVFFIVQ